MVIAAERVQALDGRRDRFAGCAFAADTEEAIEGDGGRVSLRIADLIVKDLAMLGWESGEIGWVESFVEIDHPAAVEEVASGNEHVAGVIAFTAEGGGVVGGGEELGNDVGNSEAGLLHEGFGGHATSKSRFFDGAHLIGGDEHGLREGALRHLP